MHEIIYITKRNHIRMCHKQQKASERKGSWFTGFYPNIGKTFTVLASFVKKVLKTAIAELKIHQ